MSKSNKKKKNQKANLQNNKPVVASEELAQDIQAQNVIEEAKVEESKPKADKKETLKKQKKQNKEQKPRTNKVKESVAELKKVTWPTFPQVVKNTLLVLGIVLIFTIVLFGIDFGLGQLYKLLTQ